MKWLFVLCVLPLACMSCPRMVTRPEWNANYPLNGQFQCMASNSKNVIIHHTYIPKICMDTQTCMQNMRSMQEYHQSNRKWNDIGYNFCIGGDGKIYEGRGWGVVGYTINGYEYNSTNICFIGDYTKNIPSEKMLQAAIDLIECGVKIGFVSETPRILGAREVIPTASPGDALQLYIESNRFGYPRKYILTNEIK